MMKLKNGVMTVADVELAIGALVAQISNRCQLALHPAFLAANVETLSAIDHYTLRVGGGFVKFGNWFRTFTVRTLLHGPVV